MNDFWANGRTGKISFFGTAQPSYEQKWLWMEFALKFYGYSRLWIWIQMPPSGRKRVLIGVMSSKLYLPTRGKAIQSSWMNEIDYRLADVKFFADYTEGYSTVQVENGTYTSWIGLNEFLSAPKGQWQPISATTKIIFNACILQWLPYWELWLVHENGRWFGFAMGQPERVSGMR